MRWARDRAVEGWPLPAAVVISTDSLPMSIALRLTACSKLMVWLPNLLEGCDELWRGSARPCDAPARGESRKIQRDVVGGKMNTRRLFLRSPLPLGGEG